MRDNFAVCLDIVLHHEGGFSDHPKDPGGATNFGITLRTYRQFHPGATADDLKAIKPKAVEQIYRRNYWNRVSGDELPIGVDLIVFDSAVNHGVSRGAKFAQEASGAYADGVIGPKTMEAVRGAYIASQRRFISEIAARRMRYYGSLSTFDTFGLGWSRRLMDVTTLAAAM